MVLINQDLIMAQQTQRIQQQQQYPGMGTLGTLISPRRGPAKVYIGNLSTEVTEAALKDFFTECGIPSSTIQRIFLKKGFAFVEFSDQTTANLVVSCCNSKTLLNTVVNVEPAQQNEAFPQFKQRTKLVQVVFANCSPGWVLEDVRKLIVEMGASVVSVEGVRSSCPGTTSFVARVPTMKCAHTIVNECNNKIVIGSRLQVRIIEESFSDGAGDPVHQPMHSYLPRNAEYFRPQSGGFAEGSTEEYEGYENSDIPLRIMIPNEFVGAIIGRGGATIRAISKGTGARLDIFRHFNRNYDMPEKPVLITGRPERVTQACKKILEIIAQEANHQRDHQGDIALKMFAPNSVVGRIIGRSGTVIKQIMDDTQTKIHISNQPDFIEESVGHRRSNQRLITIRGSIDGMSHAESVISEKLLEAFVEGKLRDGDLDFGLIFGGSGNHMANNRGLYNNLHSIPAAEYPYMQQRSNMNLPMGAVRGGFPASLNTSNEGLSLSRPETGYMYVPDESVGALIGRKGSSIREIIHASGASIKVLDGCLIINDFPSRRVVIHGGIESLFFAEYLIYQKVVDEGKSPVLQVEDPQLTVEMEVPTEVVGRLIGKGGANIREIQRQHFCRIKFLTEPDESIPPPTEGQTFCRITGTSHAFLLAQKKIRSLLVKAINRAFSRSNNEGNGSRNVTPVEEGPTHNMSISSNLQ